MFVNHTGDYFVVIRMYMRQAEALEQSGKLKEAERLYSTIKRVDRAMTMYKNRRQYREMARLVSTHKPELLEQTLMRIAQELECEGNLRQAEQYYLQVYNNLFINWKLISSMAHAECNLVLSISKPNSTIL